MVSGESHTTEGGGYRLQVVETDGLPRVEPRRKQVLVLHVCPGWTAQDRQRLLQRWYRERLRELAPRVLEKWHTELGVEVRAWGIKRMKTKRGSCNAKASRSARRRHEPFALLLPSRRSR